ncbi:uncharacterized protein [Periplaneta americana]|uniref:uncharacterized protein n=1 Tax=Periplaneta americana TaxID=6978 RepID=UPI0037E8E41B
MWISAAVVLLTALVLLEPAEEVDAGHSRLVIHTPQRIKVVHKYHTTEHYAKDYGYGEDHHHHKPKKRRRTKGQKGRGRRWRGRKRYLRKVGRRTPFAGGKSYGMYNYARNYRNWTPQRRPRRRYRGSYRPPAPSYEDSREDEEASNESRPFENEIHAIDYYAQRNRDYRDWNHGDHINRNSQQYDDSAAVGSHVQGYSTLPDEFIDTQHSARQDLQHGTGQDFRVNNQRFGGGLSTSVKGRQNTGVRQGTRFSNQNFGEGLEFQNSQSEQELKTHNLNFGSGHEFSRGSSNGQSFKFNNRNFGNVKNFQGSSSGQEFKNNRNFGNVQDFQNSYTDEYLKYYNQNFGQSTSFQNQNFGSRQKFQNSAGSHRNNFGEEQDSRYSTERSDYVLPSITIPPLSNRPNRETGQSTGVEGTFSRPSPDDVYYKAFRAFSFRKNPTPLGSSNAGKSNSDFSGNPVAQHTNTQGSHQQVNQWFNQRKVPVQEHDIGFLEGLEDVNDGAGI